MVLVLHVWQFGHLVSLHFPFQYFKKAIQSNIFFLLLMWSSFWVQKHKCSFMVLLLLFSPHLSKTKVRQQLASVTSVISIPFTWVLNILISCLCSSFFYCPVHTPSSCEDKGHRQPFLRRNKRPFTSFSYTIKFFFFFFKRRHGKQESHEYQLKFTCFQYF